MTSSMRRLSPSLEALLQGRLLPAEEPGPRGAVGGTALPLGGRQLPAEEPGARGTVAGTAPPLGTAAADFGAAAGGGLPVDADEVPAPEWLPPSWRAAYLAGGGSGLRPGPRRDGMLPARRMAPGAIRPDAAASSPALLLLRGNDELALLKLPLAVSWSRLSAVPAFTGLAALAALPGRLPLEGTRGGGGPGILEGATIVR